MRIYRMDAKCYLKLAMTRLVHSSRFRSPRYVTILEGRFVSSQKASSWGLFVATGIPGDTRGCFMDLVDFSTSTHVTVFFYGCADLFDDFLVFCLDGFVWWHLSNCYETFVATAPEHTSSSYAWSRVWWRGEPPWPRQGPRQEVKKSERSIFANDTPWFGLVVYVHILDRCQSFLRCLTWWRKRNWDQQVIATSCVVCTDARKCGMTALRSPGNFSPRPATWDDHFWGSLFGGLADILAPKEKPKPFRHSKLLVRTNNQHSMSHVSIKLSYIL